MTFVKRFQLVENWRFYFTVLWPLILLPIIIQGNSKTASCAYVVAIIGGYWMTEAIPMAITSLMPMFLYPLLGIQSSEKLAQEYLKDSIMIKVGSLLIALAFEYCGLHKRIALRVILFTGTSVKMLMLGIMLCTFSLSMWMSNTAITAMMVPIIMAILEELEMSLNEAVKTEGISYEMKDINSGENDAHEAGEAFQGIQIPTGVKSDNCTELVLRSLDVQQKASNGHIGTGKPLELVKFMQNTRTMFLLSCCYASNIGGTGVITGCGTNLVGMEFLGNLDPKNHGDHAALNFTTWLAFNIIPAVLNVAIAWFYLQLVFTGIPERWKFWKPKETRTKTTFEITPTAANKIKSMLQRTYEDLGPISTHEKAVSVCFTLAVASFILQDPKFMPGWKQLFPLKVSITTSALLVSLFFFIIPRNDEFYRAFSKRDFSNVEFKPLLEWEFVQKRFPWNVLILLGGGYALSNGAKKAGLSTWIGQSLKAFTVLPPEGILAITCGVIAFMTEIASNTATATLVLPILLELSKELNIHPLYLTLPATVVCSYAFMLPVATPPNAIVYTASDMKVTDMVKTGFFMNCSCVLVLYLCTISYGNYLFKFDEYNYIP